MSTLPPLAYLWDFGDALPAVNATGLYGYWPLDEASGNPRVCTLGAGPDLAETGGAVASETGRFGDAVLSTGAATSYLLGTLAPAITMSDGLTVAVWFKWTGAANNGTMFTLEKDGSTYPFLHADRYYTNWMTAEFSWASGADNVISLPTTQLGQFAYDSWHLFVLTYDPATGNWTGRIDDGCMSSDPIWNVGDTLPADHLQSTIPAAKLAAANAASFDRLSLTKALNGNFVNFGGSIDDLRIWTRVLTDAEVADLWYRSDEETPSYSYGEADTMGISLVAGSAHGCETGKSINVVVT